MANKKGRPKLNNARSKQFRIRLNDEEVAQLKFLSKELNIPMSRVIRDLITAESHRLYYGF